MAVQRCMKNGRAVWRARVKVDGRLVTAFRNTQREAIAAEATMLAPAPAKMEVLKLDELWLRVLAYQQSRAAKKPWRPSTVRIHISAWARISPVLGLLNVDQVGQAEVDAFASTMVGAQNTVANTCALLRLVLRRGMKWGLLTKVPEITALNEAPRLSDDQWFTQEELPLVLAAMRPEWRRVALVAARTGLRAGELAGLQWGDVEGGRLHVRRTWHDDGVYGPPKNGKPRMVPLPSDAAAVLGERGGRDQLVFGGLARDNDGPFVVVTYADQIARAVRAVGLTKSPGTHIMRHTYGSQCVLVGVPTRVLMSWAGWSSERMVDRYAHLRPADADHYAERLAGVTTGVTAPELWLVQGAKGP